MSNEYEDVGGWQAFKSGDWFNNFLLKAFRLYWEKADPEWFKKKYPKLSREQIAKKIIELTAKNAAGLGGATGAAMSTNELVAIVTGAEGGIGLPANIAIAAAAIAGEILTLTHFQLKMVADLAKLYDVPLDAEDPEDIWIIFAYAMGGSASELAGAFGMKIGAAATRRGVKRYVSKETLKLLQQIGRTIGIKILQKTIIKYAIPIVSIGLGTSWNYLSTKTIGKIACQHFSAWREIPDVGGDCASPEGSTNPTPDDNMGPIVDHEPIPDVAEEGI